MAIKEHIKHDVSVITYDRNISIECNDCYEIIDWKGLSKTDRYYVRMNLLPCCSRCNCK